MKAIIPVFNVDSPRSLYLQLYDYIKKEILAKAIVPEEKLPSLRNLSASLGLSLTTVELAYNQLAVEQLNLLEWDMLELLLPTQKLFLLLLQTVSFQILQPYNSQMLLVIGEQ